MISTTEKFWAVHSVWAAVEHGEVYEVECFVATDGRVVQVPGTYGYTGYALTVGKEVFQTKDEALADAHKRTVKEILDYKDSLARSEARLARLTEGIEARLKKLEE